MKVRVATPPNYDAILRTFPVLGKSVLFAYGDTVFNPAGVDIPPELMVHEEVHSKQQADNPETWWTLYLADPEFRLDEEVEAHVAELNHINKIYNRHQRRKALTVLAERLASPLYGSLITTKKAKAILKNGKV